MGSAENRHFRERLLQLRQEAELLQKTRSELSANTGLDQCIAGRISDESMDQHTMTLNLRKRTEQALHDIQTALQRIDEGEYGRCRLCDEPIAAARLELDPTQTLCIRCASAAERQGPHYSA